MTQKSERKQRRKLRRDRRKQVGIVRYGAGLNAAYHQLEQAALGFRVLRFPRYGAVYGEGE